MITGDGIYNSEQEQEQAFKNVKDDLLAARHSIKSALHFLAETGRYESFELDECADNLETSLFLINAVLDQ
jgi:hypothetical protein